MLGSRISEHYELEKALAAQLTKAPSDQRQVDSASGYLGNPVHNSKKPGFSIYFLSIALSDS